MPPWAWALFLLLLAVPVPVILPGTLPFDPLHVWPFVWLLTAAFVLLLLQVARWSVPFALLLAWAVVRTAWAGLPGPSVLILMAWVAGAALFAAAASLSSKADPWLVGGVLVAAAVNAGLGVLNIAGFDTDLLVQEHLRARPQGFLLHPNNWGVFMALMCPVACAALGRRWPWGPWVGLGAGLGLVVVSRSLTAAVALAVGILVLCWWPRRLRWILLGAGTGAVTLTAWLRGWEAWTGGRWPVWRVAVADTWKFNPWVGGGLGAWKYWAVWPHGPIWQGEPGILPRAGASAEFWTEAHSEPVQLFFELGLLGAGLGAWVLGRTLWAAWRVRQHDDPWVRAWATVVVMAAVAMWATIPFRLPLLAVTVLVAWARVQRGTQNDS